MSVIVPEKCDSFLLTAGKHQQFSKQLSNYDRGECSYLAGSQECCTSNHKNRRKSYRGKKVFGDNLASQGGGHYIMGMGFHIKQFYLLIHDIRFFCGPERKLCGK